jgi:hypothetical protein
VELANGFRRALSQANSIARGGHGKRTQSRRPWNQWGQLISVRLAQLSRQWRTLHQTRVVQRTLVHDAFMRSDPVQRVELRSRGIQCSRLAPPHNGCSLHEVDPPSRSASDDIYSNPPRFPIASITPQSRQLGNLSRRASRSLPSASAGAHAAPLVGLLGVSKAFPAHTRSEAVDCLTASVHCQRSCYLRNLSCV